MTYYVHNLKLCTKFVHNFKLWQRLYIKNTRFRLVFFIDSQLNLLILVICFFLKFGFSIYDILCTIEHIFMTFLICTIEHIFYDILCTIEHIFMTYYVQSSTYLCFSLCITPAQYYDYLCIKINIKLWPSGYIIQKLCIRHVIILCIFTIHN